MSWSDEEDVIAADTEAEFGIAVTITPPGQAPISGLAIIDMDARCQVVGEDRVVIDGKAPRMEIRTSVFGRPKSGQNWKVERDDGALGPWRIVEVQDTTTGCVLCWLEAL